MVAHQADKTREDEASSFREEPTLDRVVKPTNGSIEHRRHDGMRKMPPLAHFVALGRCGDIKLPIILPILVILAPKHLKSG